MSGPLAMLLLLGALSSGDPAPVRFLDLTGDGVPDALHLDADGLAVSVNRGDGRFDRVAQALPAVRVADVLADDLDGDGLTDLYLVSSGANVALAGDGTGRFRDVTADWGLSDAGVGTSAERVDLDGRGRLDLLVRNVTGDVAFRATATGFARDALTPDVTATPGASAEAAAVEHLLTATELLGLATGERLVLERDAAGRPRVGFSPRGAASPAAPAAPTTPGAPAAPTVPGGGVLGPAGDHLTDGRRVDDLAGRPDTRPTTPELTNLFDVRYVNDGDGEVDSADIADGSLTGADVSTSGGDVTFTDAVVTAKQGVFGVGVAAAGGSPTISGGEANSTGASSSHATVGGGFNNQVFSFFDVVAGGSSNVAGGIASTIAGGQGNEAGDSYTSIGGGRSNEATARGATIPGGEQNVAQGEMSLAAGYRAQALHDGAFVWSDEGNSLPFASTAPDQFLVDAAGGVGIGTNQPIPGGLTVAGGIESTGASGGELYARNPNEPLASVRLGWLGDVARIRVGGSGAGATSGLDIQTTGDNSLLRLEHGGRVGMGTGSPDASLHVTLPSDASASGGGMLQLGSSTGPNVALDSNEIMARSNGSTATLALQGEGGDLTIQPSGTGFVGIRTGVPNAHLHVDGDAGNDAVRFRVDGTTRLKVDANGGVAVGSNIDPGAQLHVDADGSTDALRVRVSGTTRFKVDANGRLAVGSDLAPTFDLHLSPSAPNGGTAGKPGGGSWSVASDRRLKKDVADLERALDTLLALRGVTYEYIDAAAIGELPGTRTGFIAQEVERVIPDWVEERPDGLKMLTIRGFEALAVEALRELRAENAALAARVAELEERSTADE